MRNQIKFLSSLLLCILFFSCQSNKENFVLVDFVNPILQKAKEEGKLFISINTKKLEVHLRKDFIKEVKNTLPEYKDLFKRVEYFFILKDPKDPLNMDIIAIGNLPSIGIKYLAKKEKLRKTKEIDYNGHKYKDIYEYNNLYITAYDNGIWIISRDIKDIIKRIHSKEYRYIEAQEVLDIKNIIENNFIFFNGNNTQLSEFSIGFSLKDLNSLHSDFDFYYYNSPFKNGKNLNFDESVVFSFETKNISRVFLRIINASKENFEELKNAEVELFENKIIIKNINFINSFKELLNTMY